MKNKENLLRTQGWFLTHAGVLVMLVMLAANAKNWKPLTSYSGYFAVGFLVAVLALNPLKTLFPRWMMITRLNRFRRELGVAAFSYAAIHVVCFLIKRGGIKATLPYLLHPALAPVFWVGFPLLVALAITSNKYSLKTLGFMKWKKLHKKIYLVEASVILHMVMVGEKLWAALLFIPLVVLQFLRRFRQNPPPVQDKLSN